MTEVTKTLVAVIAAVVLSLAAVVIRPQPVGTPADADIGKMLFPKFENPLATKSLEIVKYNNDDGKTERFKVAETNGGWLIPSHSNYPADAENKMRDAATLLTNVEILGVASDVATEHGMYGVVEPSPDDSDASDEGVGTLVVMQDDGGDDLARLIIGAKVKDKEDQRFVRRPSQDRVYVAEVDPDKVSTEFEEWIETDLLDINSWDIKEVLIKDYSVETAFTLRGPVVTNYDQRTQMLLKLDSSDWELAELLEKRGEELVLTELLEGEELNTERLNDMKNAFDDLQIVDVERKPKGLGANLRAEESFMEDSDDLQSLFGRGFYPVDMSKTGQLDLLCSDGEVIVRTDDGVEYVLRFGQIAGLEGGEDGNSGGLNRYLFVMTRLRADMFPEPIPTADDEQAEDAADEADAEESGEEKKDGETEDDKDEEEKIEEDELAEKREKAEEKVTKMNDRFADWYYIIPEDIFKKIHLGRGDVIKKGSDSKQGFDIDTLRELEQNLE